MRWMDGKRTLGRIGLVAALIGVELYLARNLTSQASLHGYTATNSYSVAPPRNAKVKQVAVELGATVHAGDLIAQLDTTEIENEIEVANAERTYAAAAMIAETARLRRDSVNLERRFASGTERASVELANAEASAHTAAAELAAIDAELVEQTDLVSKRLANASVLNTLQLRRAALAKQVDAASSVLRVLRGNVTAATKRTQGLEPGDADQLAPLQAQLHAADLRIAQLTRERDGLALRSPADGIIDQLPLHAGDLATPELPVATVVAPDAQRVVTCIPEARASGIEAGMETSVTSTFDKTTGTGEIESVTGTIGPLPTRCQLPGSKAVLMGRVAIIALDEPMGGLPGQTQLVKIHARKRPHDRTTPVPAPRPAEPRIPLAPPAPAAITPSPLKISSELLARTRFEPSGLIWIAALDRYMVVSDDTGTKMDDEHPPWLFTMTADGTVDPQPLVVTGTPGLNDLESIATDASGGVWLLASQSMSKKGKRPLARRQLTHVTIAKSGELRADRVLDVASLLDNAPAATRAALGLVDTRTLDIEGMAMHDGALYLGLKAPVDDEGRALIWRVAAPDKLLAGDLAAAQVTLWARFKLTVEADGRTVPAGVSDLVFWDATTLVIGVTASAVDVKTESGAVYIASTAGGELKPVLVRTFAGLKPEAIARAPKGDKLAVVFDRGSEPPLWLELPAALLEAGHATK